MNEKQIETILRHYSTPLYVFDIKTLKNRVNYLKNKLPCDVSICYAIKANTFIVKDICDYADKFEVCSPGELMICIENGIDPKKIVVSGVYKDECFFEKMIDFYNEVNCFTVESLSQYEMLVRLARKHSKKARLLLRLTSGNQFGMDEKNIKQIISGYDKDFVSVAGIQFYSATQKTSLKKIKREIEYIDSFLSDLKSEYGFVSQEFEYGPGFPVSYFDTDDFDEEEYLSTFSELLASIRFKAKITLEIGRSIAAPCGNYLTSVVDTKSNKEQNYAIVDGGLNHITYFGQSMAMKHPYHGIYPNRSGGETRNWNICGSLCTANDILMKNTPFRDLKAGDVIIFENTGAYCMTEGISLFLSRALPQVVLIDEKDNIVSARQPVSTYKLNKVKREEK